jgi:hypothetical protein
MRACSSFPQSCILTGACGVYQAVRFWRDPPIRSSIRKSHSNFPSGKQLTQSTCRSVPFRERSRDRTHKHLQFRESSK